MWETLFGEEFSLVYTLVLVAMVVAAYFYLFNSPSPPPPRPINTTPILDKKTTSSPVPNRINKVIKEVIPEGTKGFIKIIFGTQTGTAEDFARTLQKEARRYHIHARVVDMEVYDVNELPKEKYVIIVTSTHGEGEPPDTAKAFYKHVGSDLPSNLLENVNFTVFGLGSKTYEHYNAVGRYMDAKMDKLGALRFFERGEGDDDCALEEDFNKWKKRMWPVLCQHMGLDSSDVGKMEDEKFVPRFKIAHCPPSAAGKFSIRGGIKKAHTDGSPVFDIKNPFFATIAVNRELHQNDSERSCRHIEIDIGNNLKYEAGDHLGVYPENSSTLVTQLAHRLNEDLDQVIALIPVDSSLPANLSTDSEVSSAATESTYGPCTLRQILTDAIDITTPPRKAVLRALAEYAQNPHEKNRLLLLSKDGDQDEYSKWVKHDQRTITEVLNHFPSVRPPLPVLLELLPRLAPRYYSISSSPNAHPGFVHITSVVVRFHTPAGREHNGVCSTWLANLHAGSHVPVFIRESSFKLPATPGPLIMVGPGTGLAPFRGFLQELNHRKKQGQNDWESILFFGCRHRKHDYIYEEELTGFEGNKTLSHLHVAFSREQDHKVYVQDKIEEEGTRKKIWELLNEKGGRFYVCGDARLMAKSVHQALIKIAKEEGHMSEEDATTYIDNLQKNGRYLQDTWF